MSTKALKKQLMAAVAMMLVAVIALSGSTFAWFATNTKVTATAMDVTTVVDSNLFIAADARTAAVNADANFGTTLHQGISAKLQPVSTVDGKTFFYTYDAKATGEKQAKTSEEPYIALPVSNEIESNGNTYNGYVDYALELKAINAMASNQVVKLTGLNLLYDGKVPASEKAYRVAVFVQKETTADSKTYAAIPADATADVIYSIGGATNFTDGQAVASATALGEVTYNGAFPTLTVPAGKTAYYKFTFRLWLEGEDDTCSTIKFMSLDKNWELDLAFELGGTTAQVSNIGSAATTTLDNVSNELTAALTVADKVAATYEFHKIAGGIDTKLAEPSTTATYTMTAAGDYYCLIKTTDGNVYRTGYATYAD